MTISWKAGFFKGPESCLGFLLSPCPIFLCIVPNLKLKKPLIYNKEISKGCLSGNELCEKKNMVVGVKDENNIHFGVEDTFHSPTPLVLIFAPLLA